MATSSASWWACAPQQLLRTIVCQEKQMENFGAAVICQILGVIEVHCSSASLDGTQLVDMLRNHARNSERLSTLHAHRRQCLPAFSAYCLFCLFLLCGGARGPPASMPQISSLIDSLTGFLRRAYTVQSVAHLQGINCSIVTWQVNFYLPWYLPLGNVYRPDVAIEPVSEGRLDISEEPSDECRGASALMYLPRIHAYICGALHHR